MVKCNNERGTRRGRKHTTSFYLASRLHTKRLLYSPVDNRLGGLRPGSTIRQTPCKYMVYTLHKYSTVHGFNSDVQKSHLRATSTFLTDPAFDFWTAGGRGAQRLHKKHTRGQTTPGFFYFSPTSRSWSPLTPTLADCDPDQRGFPGEAWDGRKKLGPLSSCSLDYLGKSSNLGSTAIF